MNEEKTNNQSINNDEVQQQVAPVTPVTEPATPVDPPIELPKEAEETATPVASAAPVVEPATPVAPVEPVVDPATPVSPVEPVVESVTPVVSNAEPATQPVAQPAAPVAQPAVSEPVAQPTTSEPVASMVDQPPTVAPTSTPEKTKKNNTIIIIIAIVALVAIGVGVGTFLLKDKDNKKVETTNKEETPKESSDEEKNPPKESDESDASEVCDKKIKYLGRTTMNGEIFIETEDETTYYFKSNNELGNKALLIGFLSYYDNIDINICYKEIDGNKQGTKVEFFDTETNKELVSTSKEELIKELGYHSYGEYTEKVELLEFDPDPGFGVSGDKSYIYYSMKIKLNNGKIVDTKYVVYDIDNNTQVKFDVNKTYTMKFVVEEDSFELFEYKVLEIK